jgi:hypothetical protein
MAAVCNVSTFSAPLDTTCIFTYGATDGKGDCADVGSLGCAHQINTIALGNDLLGLGSEVNRVVPVLSRTRDFAKRLKTALTKTKSSISRPTDQPVSFRGAAQSELSGK